MNTDIPERVRVEDFEDDDQSYLERIGVESYSENNGIIEVPAREWSLHVAAPITGLLDDNDSLIISDSDGNRATISAMILDHPVVNSLQQSLSTMEGYIFEQARRIEQLEEKLRRIEDGTI